MRRLLRVIVHNWPLKLAAIGLATLLYGGLVLSQSTQDFRDVIPVQVENQPDRTFLLLAPEPVTLIRYFAPSGVQPTAAIFQATVDLTDVTTDGGPQTVPIIVTSVDDRITVISAEPDVAVVELDELIERDVPVEVDYGTIPTGLELGPTTFTPQTVTVSGPASIVDRVVAARASVLIQPGGIDIDEDVTLVPVDQLGDTVAPLDIDPPTARVSIPVFSDRQSRTLPVSPLLSGQPAAGFETAGVTVDPLAVTVEGDADQLVELVSIETAPVSVAGLSADQTVTVELVLPEGVVVLGSPTVEVTVTVRQITGTRSFEVGISLDGTSPDLIYEPAIGQIVVTIGGSAADLDRLDGSTLVAILDVADLDPGTSAVPVEVDLPAGLSLVAASPAEVEVTVTQPPSPSPSAAAAPASPAPGG